LRLVRRVMLADERLECQPSSYETHKREILAGLSQAQRGWERETGARLVVSETPPYFSYTTDPKGSRRTAA
jgi:hypothetical protein